MAALLKSATGPPPKMDTHSASQGHLPQNESPYFNVAAHVAKATADLDMSRTLTPADLSRQLGVRRREAQASNGQYSQSTGHKMFGSSKYARLLLVSFPPRTFDRIAYPVIQQWINTVDDLWRTYMRYSYVLDGGTPPRGLGIACSRPDGLNPVCVQSYCVPRRTWH